MKEACGVAPNSTQLSAGTNSKLSVYELTDPGSSTPVSGFRILFGLGLCVLLLVQMCLCLCLCLCVMLRKGGDGRDGVCACGSFSGTGRHTRKGKFMELMARKKGVGMKSAKCVDGLLRPFYVPGGPGPVDHFRARRYPISRSCALNSIVLNVFDIQIKHYPTQTPYSSHR